MGRLTRTCLKLCQSTSNVVITPRFKRDWIPNKLTALFLCFISRWLEYANEIIALGSRKLVFYFNIGVFHRQILPPTYLRPPLPILKKKNSKKNSKIQKKLNFPNIGVYHRPSLPCTKLRSALPAPTPACPHPCLPPPLTAIPSNCHSSKLLSPLIAIALSCHSP